ncbi:MAG TPA: hypothetical protein VHP38_13245 [Ruminiclostridium sp.]|nr:hypothetical protein [Ruminiclostridium sp.]
MSNGDDIRARLEDLKCYMYSEIQHMISESTKSDHSVEIQKYKPTRHQKAFRVERNLKKRCYAR